MQQKKEHLSLPHCPPNEMPNFLGFQDYFLDFETARQYLGNPAVSTFREWTSKRRITSYKPGKEVKYRLSDLNAFMAKYIKRSFDQLAEDLNNKHQEYEG